MTKTIPLCALLFLALLLPATRGFAQVPDECAVYQPGADDKIAYIEVQRGGAVSNVTVGGMDMENATGATRLVIDNNETRMLYLVLKSTEPVIWEITGNTVRVSRVVVAGPLRMSNGKVAAGVTGLPADRVTIIPTQKCLSNMHRIFKARSPGEAVRPILGRDADIFKSAGIPLLINVSSSAIRPENAQALAKPRPAPPGIDTRLWERFLQYAPGGVKNLRNMPVISGNPAEPYPVMPGWAGLMQLVMEGKLVPEYREVPDHTKHLPDGRTEPRTQLVFKLVSAAEWFPAGLKGGEAVAVLLAPGISLPKGDFGHCCVISEETKTPLVNAPMCKGGYGFLMK